MTAPEPVRLTEEEREALVDAMECSPWHYTEFGVLCSCGRPTDTSDDTCRMQRDVFATTERIIAARVAAAKAEAWDEGARRVWSPLAEHALGLGFYLDDNPYREGAGS